MFADHPHTSTRSSASSLNISRTSIQRILKDLHYHPYKIHTVQTLLPDDKLARTMYAEEEIARIVENPGHLSLLVTSDESHFHLDGDVNRHNHRYWSQTNPHWIQEHSLHSPRTTVWAAFFEGGIIGPIFVDENVTGENYLKLLQTDFWPQIEALGLQERIIFQQDGAPPHWSLSVRQWLNDTLPGRWIGRGSARDDRLSAWPPRSPDLSPCDFFLWGYIKSLVCVSKSADIQELKQRICDAFSTITAEMRKNVMLEYKERLHEVLENGGSHVKVYAP